MTDDQVISDENTEPDTRTAERPTKLERLESSIDRDVMTGTSVICGVKFESMIEVMNFAKLMSTAGPAIRPFLRQNPGACLAVTLQAINWGFDPFAVAQKAYLVKSKGGDENIAYESQLVRALIETRCPLDGDSLNHEYLNEGDDIRQLVCRVWAKCKVKGVVKVLSWESPAFEKIQPKNSPLWVTKPKLQLLYNTQRDWCRVHFPHVLLGVNDVDDMADSPVGVEHARDVTPEGSPGLAGRLRGPGAGFDPANVERGLNGEDEHEHVRVVSGTVVDEASGAVIDGATGEIVSDAPTADAEAWTAATGKKPRGRRAKAAAEPSGEPEAGNGTSAAQGGGDAPAATASAPAAVQAKASEPATADAYVTWIELWLSVAINPQAVKSRWAAERPMRHRLGISVDEANHLYAGKVKPRLAELGNGN